LRSKPGMIDGIAIQMVCSVNKTLVLNSFSVYFSRFYVRTIGRAYCVFDRSLEYRLFQALTESS